MKEEVGNILAEIRGRNAEIRVKNNGRRRTQGLTSDFRKGSLPPQGVTFGAQNAGLDTLKQKLAGLVAVQGLRTEMGWIGFVEVKSDK